MCEITTIFFHFCFVYIIIYGIVMNKPRIWLPLRNLVIYFFYFNYIKQLLRSTNLYISAKYFIYYGLYVQIFLFNHAIVLRNSLTTHFSSTQAPDQKSCSSLACCYRPVLISDKIINLKKHFHTGTLIRKQTRVSLLLVSSMGILLF